MKYLIIGSGGTGGSIGGFLGLSGKDVTFISRGANLKAFQEHGLYLKSRIKGDHCIKNIKFTSEEAYQDQADVIFVCVKSYSVAAIIRLIEKAAHQDTVIIPIMNGYQMGESISQKTSVGHPIEGCIYISAFIEKPGVIVQLSDLFRVVFGPNATQSANQTILQTIVEDLRSCGIDAILSDNIQRDTFKKFTFISAYAACGAYYDIPAGEMQQNERYRNTFIDLCKEIEAVGQALNLELDIDVLETNLRILDSLTPDTTASMQKDMKAGKTCEMDSLVFETLRLAKSLHIPAPNYSKICEHFGFKG